MPLAVFDPQGKKIASTTLPPELFATKVNPPLLAQAVRVYLTNQRQGTKAVKTRGSTAGSTRKIYRQKGTGRARHGDRRAPLFVGGGVAHGPTGKEHYRLRLNKSQRRQALASALTSKAQAKEIIVVDQLAALKPKTKVLKKTLDCLLKSGVRSSRLSLVLPKSIPSISRSARNLPHVQLLLCRQLHPYAVLRGGTLIFLKDSLAVLKKTFI